MQDYYTVNPTWLVAPVDHFIRSHKPSRIIDPFAGKGHLLNVVKEKYGCNIHGYDIDSKHFSYNNSLDWIPRPTEKSISLTNPPYFAKNSAKRKGRTDLLRYYDEGDCDLYVRALKRCLAACDRVVAIVPESFIHLDPAAYPAHSLILISVIEDNPFNNTDEPVCVAVFDANSSAHAELWKGDERIMEMAKLDHLTDAYRPRDKNIKIKFNEPNGHIFMRAIDSTDPDIKIRMFRASDNPRGVAKIKFSSRHITRIEILGYPQYKLKELVDTVNYKINKIRTITSDLILSPFKGNNKAGIRRRRITYRMLRGIIEESICEV